MHTEHGWWRLSAGRRSLPRRVVPVSPLRARALASLVVVAVINGRSLSQLALDKLASSNALLPPRRLVRAEVGLGPRRKLDDVAGVDARVRERERQRRGAADLLALRVVLRPVARALELVLRLFGFVVFLVVCEVFVV